MASDDDATVRLLKILDDARTFEGLCDGISGAYGAAHSHPLFGTALRFIADGDASNLGPDLQERFAQVLSRFVESKRALELAAILEAAEA